MINVKQQGFTLIEIMVVVVIIAILMGAVAMSIPRDINDLLKENAERLEALINLSQNEAILQSREFALGFSGSGYAFFKRDNNAWVPLSDGPFRRRKLPENLLTELFLDGISVRLPESADVKPQVFILSSGEVTPFAYQLQFPGQDKRIRIKVNAIGETTQEFIEE